ncbi:MAG: hypothetical protein GXY41_06730 [Phycisphaerae bacterium]|nr:hypothetical protein [Phycisphaerae bacterium]
MLYAVPKSIFSWGYEVYHENTPIAVIDMDWLTEGGSFDYGRSTYYARKAGFLSGSFSLECNGNVIVHAQKTPLIRRFEVQDGSGNYLLSAASPLTRKFILEQNSHVVGQIAPHHPFTRKCAIDLPEFISIPSGLFMFWLVLLLWRRTERASAG